MFNESSMVKGKKTNLFREQEKVKSREKNQTQIFLFQ